MPEKVFEEYLKKINDSLEKYIPEDGTSLTDAMRYSLLIGGKRVRPVLTLAFCELMGGDAENALPFACAVEMVHTYSLIFDDLPAMDNDDMRRGKPSNHKVFGEAMAMLGGLGLLSKAFELTTASPVLAGIDTETALKASNLLSRASGLDGILPGQAFDIENDGTKTLSYEEVLKIHKLKTSAMLEAAVLLGCFAAGTDDKTQAKVREYAVNVGLAFQIRDDILDVIGSSEKMGKTLGKDRTGRKTTFVDVFGVEKSQEYVVEYTEKAKKILSEFENNGFLMYLTDILCTREN